MNTQHTISPEGAINISHRVQRGAIPPRSNISPFQGSNKKHLIMAVAHQNKTINQQALKGRHLIMMGATRLMMGATYQPQALKGHHLITMGASHQITSPERASYNNLWDNHL